MSRDWRLFTGVHTYVSLDGTDCPIQEPFPRSGKWYSHKLEGSGLRYEVGIQIADGFVVWTNGGYPCGEYPDISVAREEFVAHLRHNERAIADDGYADAMKFVYPKLFEEQPQVGRVLKEIMSRHETLNGRLKSYKVLDTAFRHELSFHPPCFYAILSLIQLSIQYDNHPLYLLHHPDDEDGV